MTEPMKAAVSSAAHPVETASDLAAETKEGRSWRTPFAVVAYELAT